jgi:hypothetical protein
VQPAETLIMATSGNAGLLALSGKRGLVCNNLLAGK